MYNIQLNKDLKFFKFLNKGVIKSLEIKIDFEI